MIIIVNVYKAYVSKFPGIKRKLKLASLRVKPENFVKRSAKAAGTLSLLLSITAFFFLDSFDKPVIYAIISFPLLFGIFFFFMQHTPDVYIRRRQREIEKEVLFAGRFILVKIESGIPFFNALSDAANAHGAAGKYFQEIVNDVELGTPIEKALEDAIDNSPSERFRRVLWQVLNSLKTGIDIANTLRGILSQIAQEQIIEIKEYGKKLNSMAMFYMLIGVVVPALGTTMFIILSSFLAIQISFRYLLFAAFMLAFLQFIFISLFRSIRPVIDI